MESDIEILCRKKEKELLEKYFRGGTDCPFKNCNPENIGPYTKELPLQIEKEFRDYLIGLWNGYSDSSLKLEEQNLRFLLTLDDIEGIEEAYKDAKRVTLWERITKSNYLDVNHYKGLLYEYTKDLLMVMRHDFLEEITGKIIKCKTFEED